MRRRHLWLVRIFATSVGSQDIGGLIVSCTQASTSKRVNALLVGTSMQTPVSMASNPFSNLTLGSTTTEEEMETGSEETDLTTEEAMGATTETATMGIEEVTAITTTTMTGTMATTAGTTMRTEEISQASRIKMLGQGTANKKCSTKSGETLEAPQPRHRPLSTAQKPFLEMGELKPCPRVLWHTPRVSRSKVRDITDKFQERKAT